MIKVERQKYWGKNYLAYCQGDSIPVPFERYLDLFKGKNVLEVGPGEGRQFDAVIDLVSTCSVADISATVLANERYEKCYRFLIQDYKTWFGTKYDLIHFWYVLHHVAFDEVNDFFHFLSNHLKEDGCILFNTPMLSGHPDSFKDDGMQTTPFLIGDILAALQWDFEVITKDVTNQTNSNGMVIYARKRNGLA